MTDNIKDNRPEQCAVTRSYVKRRLLWHSDRDAGDTVDYYADKLWLEQIDDGQWCLELKVGGTVTRMPIKNIEKYV